MPPAWHAAADPNAEPQAGAPGPSWPEIWPEVGAGVHDGVVNLLLGGHAVRYQTDTT
jgi:hypothetical protein